MRYRTILPAGALLLVTVAGVSRFWTTHRPKADPAELPMPQYVGDGSCRECHRTISDSYRRTAMGRAWYLPTAENVVEDYTQNNHVYDARRDLHYQMIARDGQFFQREYRLDDSGAVVHELVRQVSYIVGSGDHVRSYAHDAGGYVTQLPISWYSEKRLWDLSPGFEYFNHRFDRPLSASCVACHNSYPEYVTATQNKYTSMPSGIGCERCHGPAEWHVREQAEDWEPPTPVPGALSADRTIVNPARLPLDRRDAVCFQRHLQGEVQFPFPDRHEFGFRSGLRLADYRSDYVAATDDAEQCGIASHAARMVQSRCYTESQGRLQCTMCHDPHIPLQEVPPGAYRQSCLQCHGADSCRRVHDSSPADREGQCVVCHMPRGPTSNVSHTVFTEHRIRRRPAPPSPDSPAQAGHAVKPAWVVLRDFWKDTRCATEREGIAHVAYALSKGGRPNLDRGIELLQQAGMRGELHRDGWRKLGLAALTLRDPVRAATALEKAVAIDPADAMSHMGFGFARQAVGDVVRARAQLETALRLAPDQLEAYPAAATLWLATRQPERARELLEESLRRNPDQAPVAAMLGSLLCQTGELERGMQLLRQAIQLDPDAPDFRVSLGSAHLARRESAPAQAQFELALRSASEHLPALLSLARLHATAGNKARSVEYAQQAIRVQPGNETARRLLKELGEPAAEPDAEARVP
jgi:Tfp pilus assembly protein PilF